MQSDHDNEGNPLNNTTEFTSGFGGEWTVKKLSFLKKYVNAFTTALKDKPFELVYLDAFSGDGIWTPEPELGGPMDGSPMLALKVNGKSFDELYLNDSNPVKIEKLRQRVEEQFPGRRGVRYSSIDADTFLERTCESLKHPKRGVVFLDPFASQTGWSSMEAIAATEVLDAVVLFPAAAIWRQLKKYLDANEPHRFSRNLTRFFGGEAWKQAYDAKITSELMASAGLDGGTQPTMDGMEVEVRIDHEFIPLIYKEQLRQVFGCVLNEPCKLEINGSPSFELIFAVSNPSHKAQALASSMFKDIIRKRLDVQVKD